MGVKYFSAEGLEDAIALATDYFSCDAEALKTEVYRKGDALTQWLILAYHGESPETHANGRFEVCYEPSGVYLELYAPRAGGYPADKAEIQSYLKRKDIRQLNPKEVVSLLNSGAGRAKIGPSQDAVVLGEDVEISISKDGLKCSVAFLAPDEGGEMLTADDIKKKLESGGVVHGISDELIESALAKKRYDGTQFPVAEGTPPQDGEDGRIVFHFSQTKTGMPKELENGKVDLYTLDLFEPVKQGQFLVTRELAKRGVSGIDVRGAEIPSKHVKEAVMPKSKNTYLSEDKLNMFADKSGMVEFVNNMVVVSEIYTVKGDCNTGVGNIDFEGSVVITGGVISGLTIKAGGGISVGGVVEASELIAGGSIELKRGMQGMDRGRLIAGGSISALFLEHCNALAGDDITADAIIHSMVEAGGDVYAQGRRGNIMGGKTKASGKVVAKVFGSVSHSTTEIELGLSPAKRARMTYLDAEIDRINKELEKLEKIEIFLSRTDPSQDDERTRRIRESSAQSITVNRELLELYADEIKGLRAESESAVNGVVHVMDTAYRGTKISIASGTLKLNEDTTFSTFKYRGGEIVFFPCEYSAKSR